MQAYRLKQDGPPGRFTVLVDRETAGQVIACDEHPGLWRIEDPDGQFMGRSGLREQAAEFLAAWFVAAEPNWS